MAIFISLVLGFLTLIVIAILLFLQKLRKTSEYFQKRGIPYIGAKLGRILRLVTGYTSLVEMERELYSDALAAKSPVVGYFDPSGTPGLIISDLDLLKCVMVKNYDHFLNRRPVLTNSSNKYLRKMLMLMEDDQWRQRRTKLSPTFTSARIKKLFPIFSQSSENMTIYLKELMSYPNNKSLDIDCIQIFSKYTLDLIASCAFGISSESFKTRPDQLSYFEQMAKQFGFDISFKFFLKFIFVFGFPKIANVFGVDMLDWESQNYFANVIESQIKARRQNNERREDFLQLMLDAQKGLLKEDAETKKVMMGDELDSSLLTEKDHNKIGFDDDEIVANALNFLMAGYDNIQSLLLLTMQCLALNLDDQERLKEEIDGVLGKNGELSYEKVQEMTYLEMVINETMRIMSPAPRTERLCTKPFTVPGTDITIEKGEVLLIPIFGIHTDSKYHQDPDRFIPERFSSENKAGRNTYSFLPFGLGPRNCIGMRFAMITVKVAVVQLIKAFEFSLCSKSKVKLEMASNVVLKPRGDLWLNIRCREK